MSHHCWVAGLRPPKPEDDVAQAVLQRILNHVDAEATGDKTRQAETGLRFPASCCYWYVHRADEEFGHITTDPPIMSASERADFVRRHSSPLLQWRATFRGWIERNYAGTLDGYIAGAPPSCELVEVTTVNSNTHRAWSADRFDGPRMSESRVHRGSRPRSLCC